MAEPFVFYFRPDGLGRPELMVIVDLRLACGLCGHPQFQRFFHATAYHPLTVKALEGCLDLAPTLGGYVCENCGDPVGADAVQQSAITVAWPDESAEVMGVRDSRGTTWRIRRGRRLDPQQLPKFEIEGEPYLTQAHFEQEAARVFSPKAALIELLEDDASGWLRVSADMAWLVAEEGELDDLLDEVQDELDLEDALFVDLRDCEPHGLGTHQGFETLTGRYERWAPPLPDKVVGALVGIDHATEIFERVLDVGRLQAERGERDGMPVWREVTTPGKVVFPHEISLEGILRRAILTGMTPGESARLTGEELVGMLLRVWKPEVR